MAVNSTSIKIKGLALIGTAAVGLGLFTTNVSAFTGWSPTNTAEQATAVSPGLTFTDSPAGNTVTCTSLTNGTKNTYAEASSATPTVAKTVDASGNAQPPQFSGCTSSLLNASATVNCTTQWVLTATSTASVDVSNVVCTINIANGSCTITVGSTANPVSVTGNPWSNSTHQLTANSTPKFNISESGFFCDGATQASESGKVQLPTAVVIQ